MGQRSYWKTAAILESQLARILDLLNEPRGMFMQNFMLLSPIELVHTAVFHQIVRHLEKRRPFWNRDWFVFFFCKVTHGDCSCQFSCFYHQPNWYIMLCSTKVSAILKNGRHFEITTGLHFFSTKWPMEIAHANFHACITKCTIVALICSTNIK